MGERDAGRGSPVTPVPVFEVALGIASVKPVTALNRPSGARCGVRCEREKEVFGGGAARPTNEEELVLDVGGARQTAGIDREGILAGRAR